VNGFAPTVSARGKRVLDLVAVRAGLSNPFGWEITASLPHCAVEVPQVNVVGFVIESSADFFSKGAWSAACKS
jgi:hypothetical protein